LRKVRKLGVRMEDEEVMFMSGREEVKSEGEERVKSWRKIVLEGVMMMDQKRKKEWKRMRMGVGASSSGDNSSSSSSSNNSSGSSRSSRSSRSSVSGSRSCNLSSSVSSGADMLLHAAHLLSVSVE
jgi:hypothetical protein